MRLHTVSAALGCLSECCGNTEMCCRLEGLESEVGQLQLLHVLLSVADELKSEHHTAQVDSFSAL